MKTALITGASSGFGWAAAELLAKNDYQLILVARREEKLKELAAKLKVPTFLKSIDVRNFNDVKNFIDDLPDDFKNMDILINSAGGAVGLDSVETTDMKDWDTMVDTNIKGTLYFTRAVLPTMVKRNTGHIINLGSIAGHAPYKGGNVYGGTKAFVCQFTRNLRTDLFGTKIRVTCIEPGSAETEFSIVRFKGNKEKAKEVYRDIKPLTAEDIAETILWVIQRPAHVNIDNIEIMPLDQTWGGLIKNRKE